MANSEYKACVVTYLIGTATACREVTIFRDKFKMKVENIKLMEETAQTHGYI